MDLVPGLAFGLYASPKQRVLDGGTQQSETTGDVAVSGADRAAQTDAASAAFTPVLDPSKIKDRIDALIDNQVAAGRITGNQADVLRQVLSAPEPGVTEVAARGRVPTSIDAFTDTSHGASEATAARDTCPSPSDTLASFIQHVQRSQSRIVGYGSDGARSSDITNTRLLDFNT